MRSHHTNKTTYAELGVLLVALAGGIATLVSAAHFEYYGQAGSLVGWILLGEIPLGIAIALLLTPLLRSARRLRRQDARQ